MILEHVSKETRITVLNDMLEMILHDEHATYTFLDIIEHVQMLQLSAGQKSSMAVIELYKTLCLEEDREFSEACHAHGNWVENPEKEKQIIADIIDGCFDKMWTCIGLLLAMDLSPIEVWEEGTLSNLRKINHVTGEIERREDGKVLKPEGWRNPDFLQFAEQVYNRFYKANRNAE